MDPLSALSVAAPVLQFVDFGAKVVGAGYGIATSAHGANQENIHTEFLVSHAEELSANLIRSCDRLKSHSSGGSAT